MPRATIVGTQTPFATKTSSPATLATTQSRAKFRRQLIEGIDGFAERIENIKQAPKRQPYDPIYVVVHEMEIDDKLREVQHSAGAVDEQFRMEFLADAIIKLADPGAAKNNELAEIAKLMSGRSAKEAPACDVEVVSRGYLKETVGINKKTGQVGSMWVVVFEATITCNYLPAELTVTDEGNVFANGQVMKQFAQEIKRVIRDEIGPTIPADRSM